MTSEKMATLRKMLEALVELNAEFLKQHKKLAGEDYPSIYEVAPRCRKSAEDFWQTIPLCVESGVGDVCDFACWRVAELRAAGYEDVHPYVKVTQMENGSHWTTVQVRVGDVIEDPMAILGALGRRSVTLTFGT